MLCHRHQDAHLGCSLCSFLLVLCACFCVPWWWGCTTATNIPTHWLACNYAGILFYVCNGVCNLIPRVSLSLASAPLTCGRKTIPLGALDTKSYDWDYANDAFGVCWCAAITDCLSYHRRLPEAFIKTAVCVLCCTRAARLDGCGYACVLRRTWEADRGSNYFPCLDETK